MRRFLPASLTGRLIVMVVALVAVASLLVASTVTLVMRDFLCGKLDDQLNSAMKRAQRDAERNPPAYGGPAQNRPDRLPSIPPGQQVGTVTVVVREGQTFGALVPEEGDLRQISTAVSTALLAVEADGKPHEVDLPALGSYRASAVTTDSGKIVQGIPTRDVDDTIASLIWWETLFALGAIAAAAVAGRSLVRRQLQPLNDVATTAHDVAAMPLSSGEVGVTMRVPDHLTDPETEVGQVGAALNKLLGHVERALDDRHESEQQVRQFVADASHELRTPLATIQGYAELTRRTATDDPAQLAQAMSKVESEAGRMSSLVDDLLLLARLDSGRPLEQSPADLSHLLLEAVNDARVVDPDRRWQLHVPDEPVSVTGDEQRLHQAITNLLTNASRHTPPGTVVTVTLDDSDRLADGTVSLRVHDDGPGIPEGLQGRVFERFTRGDSARTRESGGAGLGMSLVQAIVAAHGGSARVESSPGDTTFSLTLPAST